ncbi:O-antigen ligase family protein [Alphaproteobacteria bacterium]|nr:O-antigen ligase family protein [Alphaproteobacteria bacterium]
MFDRELDVRISGVFGDELILGSFLSRTLPLLLGLITLFYNKSRLYIFFSILLLITTDVLIFLSGERSALFYLFLTTVLIIFLIRSYRFFRIFSLIASSIIIIFLSLNFEQAKNRVIDKTISQTKISQGQLVPFSIQHQVIYSTAIKIFVDHSITGIGPKMFREVCKKPQYITLTTEDGSINGCNSHPHNTYIQLLAETGVIGTVPIFLLFCFVLYVICKQFIFLIFKSRYFITDYQVMLYIALFITLWPFIPTGNFFNNYLNILYFLPIGFLLNSYKRN